VAPALSPPKPGDRVKTDRRDALPLARLARAGALPGVAVPTGDDAALRDRTRARDDARSACQDAQVRLNAFWRRPASRDTGRANGGPAPLRGRSEVLCPPPAQPIVFHASVRAGTAHTARLQRLAQARHEPGPAWRLSAVVAALPALRGGPCTVAVLMGAAMGALSRFDPPRALRQGLGLLPAASAAGARRHQGAIPQAGNPPADGRAWKAPGPTASPPRAAAIGNGDANNTPSGSRTSAGKPRADEANAPAHWWHEANRRRALRSPWPVRSRAAGGPGPNRCRAPRTSQEPLAPAPSTQKGSAVPQKRRRPGVGSPSTACRGWSRTREPRPRPAPDGGQEGGSPPTESRRSNRRLFLAPTLRRPAGEKTV